MPKEINEITLSENFWIIGWMLKSKKEHPDFYIVFNPGEKDVPLMVGGRILLFSKKNLSDFLLSKSIKYENIDENRTLTCDIEKAMTLINKGRMDQDSVILNVINFLLDASSSLKTKLSKLNRNVLFKFADHLTFDPNIKIFFAKRYSRLLVKESMLILIGTVIINSTFWDKEN